MKKLNGLLVFLIFYYLLIAQKETVSTEKITDTVINTSLKIKPVKIDARTIGPAKSSEQVQIEEAIIKMQQNKTNPMIGYWVGAFGRNKINIALADLHDGKALGYTVCAGNFRPISGEVKIIDDSIYTFNMDEPGTNQYDGHFEFVIRTHHDVMNGSWSPFKKEVASSKEFQAKKTNFQYSTEHGFYPHASARLLNDDDVNNLVKEELELMRNEIYARHGYSFKDKDWRIRFDTTAWYIPMGIDIRDDLTDIEVHNIDLIYTYEEYAEENYDSYGR